MTSSSKIYTEHTVVYQLLQLLRERVTVLHHTYSACLEGIRTIGISLRWRFPAETCSEKEIMNKG